jgi:hypothetical protein
MDMPQGNSLAAVLNKQKCHFFFFFSYTKSENKFCLGDWYQWKGGGGEEKVKESEYGTNTVYTLM